MSNIQLMIRPYNGLTLLCGRLPLYRPLCLTRFIHRSCSSSSSNSSNSVDGCDGGTSPHMLDEKLKVKPTILTDPNDHWGIDLCHDPLFNKGTAWPLRERDRLGLRGLVPPHTFTLEEQMERTYFAYHRSGQTSERDKAKGYAENVVAKHLFLVGLQDRNETLFYALLNRHLDEMAPIVYTPVVGYACTNASLLFRRPRGMYFTADDVGEMHAIVRNWPHSAVDVIVVTDGSRILGLGDLGAHGAAIPIGKLSLYVSCGGIHPSRVMPVLLDVGTNNEKLLNDRMYLGLKRHRLTGDAYTEVVDEFMAAIHGRFPNALIQFEDFKAPNAENLLQRYHGKFRVFNDDIQGTGSVTLAGLMCALRCRDERNIALGNPSSGRDSLRRQRIVCVGAGSAGIGVCEGLRNGMINEFSDSSEIDEFYDNFWLVDKDGLVCSDRNDSLASSQIPYARKDLKSGMSLDDVVRTVQPTVLLGVSGVGGIFNERLVRSLNDMEEKYPIIFALSNPTDKAECTAEQAHNWTGGRVIFASGSPFGPIEAGRFTWQPPQVNNMYIFPGVGAGVIGSGASHVTNSMFYVAAKALSEMQTSDELLKGHLLPSVSCMRRVSLNVATAVAIEAERLGLATNSSGGDWKETILRNMWKPAYSPVVYERRNR